MAQKLGAPIVSQPGTGAARRKHSANSTQSDSRLHRAAGLIGGGVKVGGGGGVGGGSKVAPRDADPLAAAAHQQHSAASSTKEANAAIADRQINRNLPLAKATNVAAGLFGSK